MLETNTRHSLPESSEDDVKANVFSVALEWRLTGAATLSKVFSIQSENTPYLKAKE
jgi:hypothetical protein